MIACSIIMNNIYVVSLLTIFWQNWIIYLFLFKSV